MRYLLLALTAARLAAAAPIDDAVQLLRAGQPGPARERLTAYLATEPGDLSARFWRAEAAAALADWPAAAADLRYILEHKADSAQSWLRLAGALAHLGDRAAALAALSEAEQRDGSLAATAAQMRIWIEAIPATGGLRRIGFEAPSSRSGQRLEVVGAREYDYTFGSAPTDWEPLGGVWSITNRYACEPEWSFFGGQSRGLCAIWNKRRFAGDMAVEAYVAFKHGLPWADDQWFYQPSDLNLSLAVEGGDLSTGYSFIFSGNHGRSTQIRHGSTVLGSVDDDPDFLLPQFADSNPLFQVDEQGRAFGSFHRHWWRLEARREAGRLRFLIGGRQALDVPDPDRSRSGHVVLWTVNSGMVIARCRISYERELAATAPAVRNDVPAALPSAGG